MRKIKDPSNLFSGEVKQEDKWAYIFLLQRYLTNSPESNHIRARIAELSGEKVQEIR